MLVYILNFISIPIYATFVKNKKKLVMLLSIQFFLLLALRSETLGTDLATYKSGFEYIATLNFRDLLSRLHLFQTAELKYPFSFESGYTVANWIFSKLGLPFYAFLVAYAALFAGSVGHFIYKYSELPWISFCLLLIFSFFEYSFSMLRQTTAMCILLFSVKYLIDGKKLSFLSIVLIAFTFHRSAILFLLLFVCVKIRPNKKFYSIICLIDLLLMLVSPFLYDYIISPLLVSIGKGSYATGVFSINSLVLLMFLIAALIYFSFDFKQMKRMDSIAIMGFFVALFIEVLGMNHDTFARTMLIPFVFILVLVPSVIKRYPDKKVAFLVKQVFFLLGLAFMIYQYHDSAIVPYIAFFK